MPKNKSFPSYSTSNPSFSTLVISHLGTFFMFLYQQNFFITLFYMMLFNMILLNQPIQNILVFDILMDLILLLLVYLQFYSSMSDGLNFYYGLNFYFKQHKHHLKPSFDFFLTCSILKVTCNININNFGLHLKVLTLLTVYILLCPQINFLLMWLMTPYFWQVFEQVL